MNNSAVIAVAGAGKTTMLAQSVASESDLGRTLVLTYTTTNQLEDSARIASCTRDFVPKVMGWFTFLLNEIVRPYLPLLYPEIKLSGLAFKEPQSFKYLSGSRRYFSKEGKAYPSFLGKLSTDLIAKSKGRAIGRLEDLYDSIYIDEAQDLRGNDLVVLEHLFQSKMRVSVVLDPRQSTIATTNADQKYKKRYSYYRIIELYKSWEAKGMFAIEYMVQTHRSIASIARFSDVIVGPREGFLVTESKVSERGEHDGIFLIDKESIPDYSRAYHATLLAYRNSSQYDAIEAINFKLSKGMTRDDAIVVATGPIEDFLIKDKLLSEESACAFYVAVTRARYSVAIAGTNPFKVLEAVTRPDSIWRDIPFALG